MTLTFVPHQQPSYGYKEGYEGRLLQVDFGDGYTQRSTFGINTTKLTVNLEWEILTPDESNEIIAFFISCRGGVDAFYYTLPRETSPRKFTCASWDRSIVSAFIDSVNATFVEQYDLL